MLCACNCRQSEWMLCWVMLLFFSEQNNTSTCSTLHPFNGLFSRTTCVSRYQKSRTSLGLNKARDVGVWGWQWHQLDHMQTVCTSLQTDNHTNTPSLNFFTGRMLFLVHITQGAYFSCFRALSSL